MQGVQLSVPDSSKARPAGVFTQHCSIVIDPKTSPEPPLQLTLALHDTTELAEIERLKVSSDGILFLCQTMYISSSFLLAFLFEA